VVKSDFLPDRTRLPCSAGRNARLKRRYLRSCWSVYLWLCFSLLWSFRIKFSQLDSS